MMSGMDLANREDGVVIFAAELLLVKAQACTQLMYVAAAAAAAAAAFAARVCQVAVMHILSWSLLADSACAS